MKACGIELARQQWPIWLKCANFCLAGQHRTFVVDDENRELIKFLLLYFNGDAEAENVFPDKGYRVHKNLLICGDVGVGKTLLMQTFNRYMQVTHNPRVFRNVSVTQMINYYKLNNHIDRYTFNEQDGAGRFEGHPYNICLNDVGLQTHQYFGTDTKVMICEFMYARADIWQQQGKFAHITTNLSPKELRGYFDDGYGRIVDRFKAYNIIHMTGKSRR